MRPAPPRFGAQYSPNTQPGTASVMVRANGKTKRDRAKAEHPLRALREGCAAIGSRPAADDTEALMNARLRGPKSRKLG